VFLDGRGRRRVREHGRASKRAAPQDVVAVRMRERQAIRCRAASADEVGHRRALVGVVARVDRQCAVSTERDQILALDEPMLHGEHEAGDLGEHG